MRSPLIALSLCASTALAQTTDVLELAPLNSTDTEIRVPREPCDLTRTVTWSFNSTTVPCSGDGLRFWFVSGSSCADEPTADDEIIHTVDENTVASLRSGQFTFEVSELPGFTGEVTCPADGREDSYRLCASIEMPEYNGVITECKENFEKADLKVIYDAKPPSIPNLESVSPLDGALSVRVEPPDDANRVRVTVERLDGTGSRTVEQSTDQRVFRVDRLENGVTYRVTARAVDGADNESEPSEALEGTPVFTRGFLDRYVEAGGQEMGGCGAAGGGLAGGVVMAVLGLWLSSRRNRS